jgi:hypothetical protein
VALRDSANQEIHNHWIFSGFMKDVSLRVFKLLGAIATLDKPVENAVFLFNRPQLVGGTIGQ